MVRLTELRERVRRIERPAAATHGVLPFGVPAIDRVLPGGGLGRGALHEILGAGGDEEDGALAVAFAAGIIGRLAPAGGGIVLWCLKRPDLYGPGLAALGLDPARLVLARAARDTEILWAMEEGLRSAGAAAAVVGEIGTLPAVASRRLQLAAERSGVTAFLLRRWRDAGEAARERNLPNAAVTRWRIAALPSAPTPIPIPSSPTSFRPRPHPNPPPLAGEGMGVRPRGAHSVIPNPPPLAGEGMGGGMQGRRWARGREEEPGVGPPRWRVELLRCRGGEPGCWEVETADATNSLSLATELADRPAASPSGFEQIRRAG